MRKAIIIMAGHGGKDPGANGNGYVEKHEALVDAKLFRGKMEEYDVDIYMLRSTDVFIPINEIRNKTNEIAEKYVKWVNGKKDYSNVAFVSHHWNSFRDPAATGWEIFANYPNTEGNKLAVHIHREVKSTLTIADRGVKYARGGLGVLRANPATVLIEHCFISNPSDISKHLANRDNLAEAYARGVASYLGLKRKAKEEVKVDKKELDQEVPKWAEAAVKYVQEEKIMLGDTEDGKNFNPNKSVTRAELATVIYRINQK